MGETFTKQVFDSNEKTISRREYLSVQRRIRFTGSSRRWLESYFLANLPRSFGKKSNYLIFNIVWRFLQGLYDVKESLLLLKKAPHFGDIYKISLINGNAINQHPNYLDYWYDEKRNALVGMHFGIDFVKQGDKFYLLELNLDAAMLKKRRELYQTELDPVLNSYLHFAKSNNFKKLHFYRMTWPEYFVNEVNTFRHEWDVQVELIETFNGGKDSGLPDPLEENSLYVIFSRRQTPMEYLLTDKYAVSQWTREYDRHKLLVANNLQFVPTFYTLPNPPNKQDDKYPNLVIKLAATDVKRGIIMAKVRDVQHAEDMFGNKRKPKIHKFFNISLKTRIQNLLFDSNKVLYQPFIIPDKDEKNCLAGHRIVAFFSPLKDFQIAMYGNASSTPVPDQLPFGVVPMNGIYLPSWRYNGYLKLFGEEEQQTGLKVVNELGSILRDLLGRKFKITPEGTN